MLSRTSITLALAAATLTACGAPASDNAMTPATDDATYARIRDLPPASQRAVFLRAIMDAKQPCQGVTDSAALAPEGGRPAWSATCNDGSRWLLVLQPDGVMKVTGPVPPRGG